MKRRSQRAHTGYGQKTVAFRAVANAPDVMRHTASHDVVAVTGDDHVN
jgi:hypothetical protein